MQVRKLPGSVFVVAAILLAGAAALVFHTAPETHVEPSPVPSPLLPWDANSRTEGPMLAGLDSQERPPGSAAATATDDAGLSQSLRALADAVRANDSIVIYNAIAAVAREICAQPTEVPQVLAAAVEEARTGSLRYATAIAHAIGRCPNPDVLKLLLQTLRSEDVPAAFRDALIISVAQRREAELSHRPGPGCGKGDTHIDAPIQEAFVRAALLDLLEDTLNNPTDYRRRETLHNCLFALGSSAALDDRVMDRFRLLARSRPDLSSTVLLALRLSPPDEAIESLARESFFLEGATEGSVQQSVALLMNADPKDGLSAVVDVLAADDFPDLRKSWILAAMPGMSVVPDDAIGHLEQVAAIAATWVKDKGTITAPGLRTAGREGTTPTPRHVDPQLVFGMFLRSSHVAVQGRSHLIGKLCADSLVYWLERTPGLRPRQVDRIISVQLTTGGAQFVGMLIDRLERSEFAGEVLLAVLVASRKAVGDDPAWAVLRPRVHALANRLSEEQRGVILSDVK